jgi:hypothetical protein
MISKKRGVAYHNPNKPEALVFEDFGQIEFDGEKS